MAADGVDPAVVTQLEEAVAQAQEAVVRQGDIVRGLKAEVKDGRAVRVRSSSEYLLDCDLILVTAGC